MPEDHAVAAKPVGGARGQLQRVFGNRIGSFLVTFVVGFLLMSGARVLLSDDPSVGSSLGFAAFWAVGMALFEAGSRWARARWGRSPLWTAFRRWADGEPESPPRDRW